MRKFEHVCSEATRKVLLAARKEPNVFVAPQDFPTVSDEHYLLFHQLGPIIGMPPPGRSSKKQQDQDVALPENIHIPSISDRCGLCCKHCALLSEEDLPTYMLSAYYPGDIKSLVSRKLSLLFL